MRNDGAGWSAIAAELGCAADVAMRMAARYERDTDEAAAWDLFALFGI